MRFILFFLILPLGAMAQQAEDTAVSSEEMAVEAAVSLDGEARQEALSAIFAEVYGDAHSANSPYSSEEYAGIAEAIGSCAAGPDEAAEAAPELQTESCADVIQAAFEGGLSPAAVRQAIEEAGQGGSEPVAKP